MYNPVMGSERGLKRFEERFSLGMFLITTTNPHVFVRRDDGGSEKLDFGSDKFGISDILEKTRLRSDCDFIDVTGNNKFTGLADGIRLREIFKKK